MNALKNILVEKISKEGSISFADYMQTCLYHEDLGYYMKKNPLGTEGDFTTAPEISQIFGEMIGAWVADSWIKMGKPAKWQLLEGGPGRGTLMKDMLRTLEYALPECYEGAEITLLEISPTLKVEQRNNLSKHNIKWAQNLADVDFSLPTLMVANELLDAFPIQQYAKGEEGHYYERRVTYDDKGGFSFVLSNEKAENQNISGDVFETSQAMESFLCQLKDKLSYGAALFIDYGDMATGNSLQAVQNHKATNIFENVGECDLTAHVNFNNVRRVLGAERTSDMECMATFLTSIGLPMRAAALLEKATSEQKTQIEEGLYRLLHPEQMGEMFKVMAYRTHPELDLAGLYFEPAHKQESHAA